MFSSAAQPNRAFHCRHREPYPYAVARADDMAVSRGTDAMISSVSQRVAAHRLDTLVESGGLGGRIAWRRVANRQSKRALAS